MKLAMTPFSILGATLLGLLAVLSAVVSLALDRPWLGLELVAPAEGPGLVIRRIVADGPAADAGLAVGDVVLTVAGLALEPFDIVEEPDTLRSYAIARALYARQGRLEAALRAGRVEIEVAGRDGVRRVGLEPRDSRPLTALPAAFWMQAVVGAGGVLIGIWVWCLRRRDLAAQLIAVAGGALGIMVFPAAVYSTRELALPPDLFRVLAVIDHFGAFAFGVAMVMIFHVYPRQIIPLRHLMLLPVVMGLWWLADTLQVVFPGAPTGFHLPAFLMLLAFAPAAVLQYRKARTDPVTRAALRWFTLSVVVGTGTFVALVVLPNLFGFRQLTSQANAFLLLLIVFGGIGLSVARYRLFELEHWAFGLLYNFAAMLLILAVDALLIYLLAFNRIEALSLALIAVLLAYLPLRDWIRRAFGPPELPRGALFQRVVDVALTPPDLDQDRRWEDLLRHAYDPLHLQRGDPVAAPAIVEEGLGLALPAVGAVAPVRLSHARGGRKLFTRAEVDLAVEICAMLGHALESRHAREAGVAEERARIARDMHDNIGATLLSALHYPGAERKDAMIRDALSDFRAIINETSIGTRTLDEVLANLRVECADRLEATGIALDWDAEADGTPVLSTHAIRTLRSILREAVSNVLRHAGASRVTVRIRHVQGRVELSVKDDGQGFRGPEATEPGHGHGLTNMRTRLEALNGRLHLQGDDQGVELTAAFVLG